MLSIGVVVISAFLLRWSGNWRYPRGGACKDRKCNWRRCGKCRSSKRFSDKTNSMVHISRAEKESKNGIKIRADQYGQPSKIASQKAKKKALRLLSKPILEDADNMDTMQNRYKKRYILGHFITIYKSLKIHIHTVLSLLPYSVPFNNIAKTAFAIL